MNAWALEAATDARITLSTILDQAVSAGRLRASMPAPPTREVAAARAEQELHPGDANAQWAAFDAEQRALAADEDARRQYHWLSNENRRTIDFWTAPPTVLVETASTAPAGAVGAGSGLGGPGVGAPVGVGAAGVVAPGPAGGLVGGADASVGARAGAVGPTGAPTGVPAGGTPPGAGPAGAGPTGPASVGPPPAGSAGTGAPPPFGGSAGGAPTTGSAGRGGVAPIGRGCASARDGWARATDPARHRRPDDDDPA